jgi:signal-transduction protein with cAMP-binding, CBS, and nucleotidyltransferase domain
MTRNPVACDAKDRLIDVARLMKDKGVGFVVVLRRSTVVGVIMDRQITIEAVAMGLSLEETTAEHIMTQNPATANAGDTLFNLVDTFRGAGVVRRVPVVNEQRELLGVVSVSDLAVVAKDLIDALLLEDTRHATKEAKLPTGGKRIQKEIRSGKRASLDIPHHDVAPVRASAVAEAPRHRTSR